MTSIRNILSICAFTLFFVTQLHAQQMELRYLGVSQVAAAYTSEQMMSLYLRSNATNKLDVSIEFVVHNQKNELVANLRSDVFQIGANQSITGPRFAGTNGTWNRVFTRPSFDRISSPNFGFPAGIYKICAYVKSRESVILGQICYEITVQSPFALHLIYPFDGQTVEEEFPVFSWTPVMFGLGQRVNYRIRWVESGGDISKEEFNERPAFFIQEKLRTSYLPYNSSFEDFDPSKTYLWKVQALSNNELITESEIWEFNFERSKRPKTPKGPYVKIEKSTKNNVVYLKGNVLNVEIDNPYSKVDLEYSIAALQQTPVISGTWASGNEAVAGKNYKSIELNNKIIPGRPYRLSVVVAGEMLELFFVKN